MLPNYQGLNNFRYYKTSIHGAKSGKLSGKRVAIKDSVCVAGVPMMAGSALMEGYVPEIDATLVTRILDEGKDGGTVLFILKQVSRERFINAWWATFQQHVTTLPT